MSEDDKDKIADMNDIWKNIRDTSVRELTVSDIDSGVLKFTTDLVTPEIDTKFDINNFVLSGGTTYSPFHVDTQQVNEPHSVNSFLGLDQDTYGNKFEIIDPVTELEKQVKELKTEISEERAENTKKYNELEERVSYIENELIDLKVQKNTRKRRDKLARDLREITMEVSKFKPHWKLQKDIDDYEAKDTTNA